MRTPSVLLLPLLAGCGPDTTWLEGTWRLDRWTATLVASGTTLLDEARDAAGSVRFEGDGEMWTSIAYVEVPEVLGGMEDLRVVERTTWVYWAFENPEGVSEFAPPDLAMAWHQAYGESKLWDLSDRDDSSFTATNTTSYTLWPAPEGEITVTWRLSRAEGE